VIERGKLGELTKIVLVSHPHGLLQASPTTVSATTCT
jgi:hypothetical protein